MNIHCTEKRQFLRIRPGIDVPKILAQLRSVVGLNWFVFYNLPRVAYRPETVSIRHFFSGITK